MSNNDELKGNSTALNKRQRFLNIMRTTRDVYVPTFSTTISQLKSDASSTIKSYYDASAVPGSSSGAPVWPTDMKTLVYPSYTRIVPDGHYETHIRGLVFTPGTMNRKSRLILSFCRQLIRPASPGEKVPLEDDKEEIPFNDSQSTVELSPASPSLALDSTDESTLRARIAGFLQKHIMGVTVVTDISNQDGTESECTYVATDNWGNYDIRVVTKFKPEKISVTIDVPDGVSTECPVNFVQDRGFALISDVDDTIKHTGVTGDKRSLFTNVFVHDFKLWSVPGMPLWYNTLRDTETVDFFYVSNCPFQLYSLIEEYIFQNFPRGPLFLKQYSGNLVSSLMSSSAKRKLGSILSVLADFPHKKFILVGDSGERDLEAYTEAVKQFPGQISAIYIRACKDSMSDLAVNDSKVVNELNSMIEKNYHQDLKLTSDKCTIKTQEQADPNYLHTRHLAKLDAQSKSAPTKPLKKPTLDVAQQMEIECSKKGNPPLPPRKPATFNGRDKDPLTFNRSNTDDVVYCTPSSQNDYGAYSTFFDSRADSWRQRVMHTILEFKNCGADVRVQFFTQPELCLEDSIATIRREKNGQDAR
ncbi:LADA_0E08878g1_1 [Lachancea dasiensis]|uniref:LADA_0E08878g1_1 n=1 Tax=Lachancea dasiensis TaxID=1072105 RepID=A0A1G4JDG2_9SACH|nr:LADA_0E08878g1_1 [Lachancea dasiensis]